MSSTYRTWGKSRGNRLPSRCYEPGHPVHVVIGTARGEALLMRSDLARAAFDPLVEHPGTLAAALLDRHVHWLLDDTRSLVAEVGRYKSITTRVAWELGVGGRLWQRSFWDRVIRRDEDLLTVALYVAENPVRAGLCQRIVDYPFVVLFEERITGGWALGSAAVRRPAQVRQRTAGTGPAMTAGTGPAMTAGTGPAASRGCGPFAGAEC